MTDLTARDFAAMMLTDAERVRLRRERLKATMTDVATAAGVSRDTVSAIESPESGVASRGTTLRKVTDGLTALEDEAGLPPWADEMAGERSAPTPRDGGIIEFDITGDFGVHVVVKGPVVNAELLREQAAALIREIRNKGVDHPEG